MPSKQNSQIVMPPLVRGAQVSGAGWGGSEALAQRKRVEGLFVNLWFFLFTVSPSQ